MTATDQTKIVQSKLGSSVSVLFTHNGNFNEEQKDSHCVLALVQKDIQAYTEYALFIFTSPKKCPESFLDLFCKIVIPIDDNISCNFDTENDIGSDGVNLCIRLTGRNSAETRFKLAEGEKTNNFISELFRLIDTSGNSKSDFSWIEPYLTTRSLGMESGGRTKEGLEQFFLDSSEMAIQRQNIAKGGQSSTEAREKMIKSYMSLKANEYTYTKTIRIFIGTWNVNGQQPGNVNLNNWLISSEPEPNQQPPDIYAVGFQELDLSKEAFLFNETPREQEWLDAVNSTLQNHRKVVYFRVCVIRLVGMMLVVFVQDKHKNYVKNISCSTVGTGIMGKMGNKGGVGVRFNFHSTSVCFVNSHLAAHVEEFERRNQDFSDISSRMSFTVGSSRFTIKDHDQIYWLGDLNYRVTDLDPNVVKELLHHNNYRPILEYDQLNRQKALKRVFDGYTEGPITFKPTYKYDTGTDNWDSSEKNRAPAWCDRILWKGEDVEQIVYRSHPVLKISDHKPVSSLFESKVRVIDEVKQRKTHEEVIKCLDKLENEFLPQVMVDNNEIFYDTVRYMEPVSKELIIANTGQVPAQFVFIKKLDDASYCKDWLHIEPYESLIAPGQKCDVKLEIYVDKKSACKLNSGEDKLYDILVLHLEGGKDIFITVTGTYERSCFGSSIEALVRISVPIREIPIGKLIELENSKSTPGGQEPYPVPKEIWFLIDHLYRHGLKQQIFITPGLHSEIIQIRNWLDNGSSDPLPGSVHSIAEALLLLLESTSEPLIPYNLHSICMSSSENYSKCKQITMQLPEYRKNVFTYLCAFLQELLCHSSENELDANILATVFGRIFFRDPPRRRSDDEVDTREMQMIDKKKCKFVYHFIMDDKEALKAFAASFSSFSPAVAAAVHSGGLGGAF